MDDAVRAAVRLAMAREAALAADYGNKEKKEHTLSPKDAEQCELALPLLPQQSFEKKQSSKPSGSKNRKRANSDIIKTSGLVDKQRKLLKKTNVDNSKPLTTGTGIGAEDSKPMDLLGGSQNPLNAVVNSGYRVAKNPNTSKCVGGNWNALRKTLVKKGGKPRQNPRSRPKTFSGTPPVIRGSAEAPLKPLAGSVFFKGALRNTSVKPTRLVALDCEFVGVGPDGKTDALARASLVNSRGEVLFDSFVRVEERIVDYRTQWSGVRPEDVKSEEAADPREVRAVIAELLKGRILVGHAVQNDLRVLRIQHPRRDTRDTSLYYKKLWRREGRRGGAPPALRLVVARVLGVDQFQKKEHDSCEDARAALALYKKNSKAWESGKGL